MPTYEYVNKNQGFEIFRSMKEDIPSIIHITKKTTTLYFTDKPSIKYNHILEDLKNIKPGKYCRKFSIPHMIVDNKKPKTIGALAAKNTERMVKEGKLPKKESKIPPWRKSKKIDKSLANMTAKQKRQYIMTGKKNA